MDKKEEKVEKVEKTEKVEKAEKVKKPKKPMNLFLLFAIMVVFFALEEIIVQIFPIVFVEAIKHGRYGYDLLYEVGATIVIFAIILFFGYGYIFKEKKEKFWKSVMVGAPFVVFATINLLGRALSIKHFSIISLISILLLSVFVGIYEELLCRGWLQNTFVRGHNKKYGQVLLSIALSSLIFGLMHIVNALGGQSLFETLMQILQASAMGFYLGAIYYRTKNIFAVMFIHGFWDFAILISDMDNLRSCTNGAVTNEIFRYSVTVSGIISVLYIVMALYILRKEKVNPLLDEPEETKKKKFDSGILIALAIVLFVALTGVKEPKGYDGYTICYDYETKEFGYSEITFSQRAKFTISYADYKYELYLDDKDLVLENTNTKDKVVLLKEVKTYKAIEEKDGYVIGVVGYDENNNHKLLYTNFITFENMSNSKEYLEQIKDSLKEKSILPQVDKTGVLTNETTDFKYFLIVDIQENYFVVDEKGDLYLVKFTNKENEVKKEEKKEEVQQPIELPGEEVKEAVDPLELGDTTPTDITEAQIEEYLDVEVIME